MTTEAWLWLGLALLALLGAPLFALIGAAALIGFHFIGYDIALVAVEFNRLADMPGLVAIPLFTLAGYLLGASKAPQRLVRLSDAWLGGLPGGLAIVAIITCALFTAFTGATGATIVALGALLYPALLAAGYPKRYVLGLLTSAGSLGLLFAPSLPLILFGFVAAQLGTEPSVGVQDLFLAGLLPGLMMVGLLVGHAVLVGRHLPAPETGFSWRRAWEATRGAAWELPLPVIVLGGIYGGFFAASEAAAITALYVLLVTVLIRREIPLPRLPAVMAESMRMVGVILIILGMALALSNWLIDQEVPTRLFEWVSQRIESPIVFLLLLSGFLLLVGMLLDIFSAIVILVPILMPVALGFGIHPAHLGVLMLANLQLGYFTPPVGINLFIASVRFKVPLEELVRACLPFFFILLAAIAVIVFWPWLSLALLT